MRANRLMLGVAVIVSAGLGACGTIIDGGTQTVDVVVKGSPTAFCEFTTTNFRNAGHFPNKLTVERSRENLKADCTGEQNRHVAFEVKTDPTAAGTTGNLLFGVVPGIGYDTATGALWGYPDPIIVDFRTVGEGPKPNWPANRADDGIDLSLVGTAPIAPPAPVRMLPIMDEDLNPSLPKPVTKSSPVEQQSGVVDAVRLATDKPVAVTTVTETTVTETTTVAPVDPAAQMAPVLSPEDKMGLEPAKVKAEAAAKEKAKEDAARKAKEDAEAKKRAEEEAAAAAKAQEAAKVQTLPETTATPPGEAATPASQPATPAEATPATPAPTPTPSPADETSKPEGSAGTGEPAPGSAEEYLSGDTE